MSLLVYLIFGAIAGWVADLIMNRDSGLLVNIILGVIGSAVGSWIASAVFNSEGVTGFNLRSLVVAVLGAIVVIWVGRLLF